jgi:hypothetical protein
MNYRNTGQIDNFALLYLAKILQTPRNGRLTFGVVHVED